MNNRPPQSFASASEVARKAGVSRSAVSRTFTEGASVSEETRRKVLAAAEELNYHVNHLARGLSQEKSRPICILGGDLHAPYQSALLEAITRRIQAVGRAAMVINTAGNEADIHAALHQTLNYRASATIVLSGAPPVSLVRTCIESGQHVILINRAGQIEEADHISLDHETAMNDAWHMLARAGCRSFAIVSSTNGSPSLLAREQLFSDAVVEAGFEPPQVIKAGSTSYRSGAEAARRLLPGAARPDAVFCVTDLLACGFLDVARNDFQLKIPTDLCVIGFDDIEQASWEGYAITTFRQPIEEMAEAIVKRLTDERSDAEKGHVITFKAFPVWRKTVRA
ncbi:substrate-binding domain-containing protein [Agrobacterium sp.]|uniref:LacI family DNA-binding transcriptional regulator n=1 Tax=Agrobacterium sp. TaxID=361 RepID=UPI0028AA1817|nr:substrate-binding domain-containing protein [Agrobacterium sp.]